MPQSGICPAPCVLRQCTSPSPPLQYTGCIKNIWLKKKYRKGEYVQRHVCFVNVQSSLPENVVFSASARMDNAAYNIFIMWNSISCLSAWYYFRFNVSCGVAIIVRSRQIEFQVIF